MASATKQALLAALSAAAFWACARLPVSGWLRGRALDGLVAVVPAGLPHPFFLCTAPARALAPACDQPASRRGRRLPARLRPHGPGPGPFAGPGTHGRWAAALAVVPAPARGGTAGGTAGAHGRVPGPAQEPAAGRGAPGPAQKLTPPATDLSRYRPDGLLGHGYIPECGM